MSQDDRMSVIERRIYVCSVCGWWEGSASTVGVECCDGYPRENQHRLTEMEEIAVVPEQHRGAVEDRDAAVRLLNDAQTTIIDTDLRREWEAERARLRALVGRQ